MSLLVPTYNMYRGNFRPNLIQFNRINYKECFKGFKRLDNGMQGRWGCWKKCGTPEKLRYLDGGWGYMIGYAK